MVLTEQKRNYLERLSTKDGVISALAFDQRGALKRLMAKYQDTEPTVAQMEELKVLVAGAANLMARRYFVHTGMFFMSTGGNPRNPWRKPITLTGHLLQRWDVPLNDIEVIILVFPLGH